MSKKILIIKLGASGDVIRTLPLLIAIKKKYPDSEITWITKEHNIQIFTGNPYVHRVFSVNNFPREFFDILYNFDIDDEATKIASKITAEKKCGFYQEEGYPISFNPSAEYYLNTLFDDTLKKTNKKTYQEMMFELAELPYSKEPIMIFLTEQNKSYSKKFVEDNKLEHKKILGIYAGSSPRWPSKVWNFDNLKEFIKEVKQKDYEILLLGGPDEENKYRELIDNLNREGIKIYTHDLNCSLMELASLIDLCEQIICPDSVSLHISLALKKPTIALFFCTSPNELEGYGLLTKIVSPIIYDFFPEKSDEYSEELTKSISVKEVLDAFNKNIPVRVVNAIVRHPNEEKFLIIKRKGGIHSGKWAFPGGILENNETVEGALKRELREETGLDLKKIIKKVSEYSYLRPDGKRTIGVSFLVDIREDKVLINEESVSFKWTSLEEIEQLDFIDGLDEEIFNAFYA